MNRLIADGMRNLTCGCKFSEPSNKGNSVFDVNYVTSQMFSTINNTPSIGTFPSVVLMLKFQIIHGLEGLYI